MVHGSSALEQQRSIVALNKSSTTAIIVCSTNNMKMLAMERDTGGGRETGNLFGVACLLTWQNGLLNHCNLEWKHNYYCSLARMLPMGRAPYKSAQREVGTLSCVVAFKHERAPMTCL